MQLSDYHCWISTICIMYWSTWIHSSTFRLSMPACVDIWCNNRQVLLSTYYFCISTKCKSSDRHWFIDRHFVKRLSMYARVDTLKQPSANANVGLSLLNIDNLYNVLIIMDAIIDKCYCRPITFVYRQNVKVLIDIDSLIDILSNVCRCMLVSTP